MKFKTIIFSVTLGILGVGVSAAFAALTFNGTGISGDSNSTIDATGTVTIGGASATGVQVGRSGITVTLPGSVTITGTTTTLQNLVVSGSCGGCGGGTGTVTTSSAITIDEFPFWGTTGAALSGTSTLTVSGTTITQANNFLIGGALNVTSTLTVASATTLNSSLTQSGGVVSLASTTINGNATTTGNMTILGFLFDASGNKYVTSTGAGTIPTINGINSSTFNFLAAGTGLSVASSASPNNITYTWTNPGFVTAASSVTWSAAQNFNAATTFSMTSTFASATIFSALASSGSPCLTIGNTGAVATTTCNSGGGGSSGTITAATSTYVAFYAASTTLAGTSTFTFTSSTSMLSVPGANVSTNLTIPTNESLTTAGQIAVKTTSSTLNFNDGTAERVLDPVQCTSPFVIQNVTSTASDEVIWSPYATSTIVLFRSVNLSTGDTMTFNIIWGPNRSTASSSAQHLFAANVTSTSITGWDTYPSLIAFASTTVPGGSFVRALTTSAASSSEWTTQICYRENP